MTGDSGAYGLFLGAATLAVSALLAAIGRFRQDAAPPGERDNRLIRPRNAAFIDVETTGLSEDDRIVSLAIILVPVASIPGDVNIRYTHEIYNPGRPCHPRATEVHGFNDLTLSKQPDFSKTAADIVAELESADLYVAHNAEFDLGFIERELRLAGQVLPIRPRYCTMLEHRRRKPRTSAALVSVARSQLLLRSGLRHSALEDAYLCARIYFWQQGLMESFPLSVFPSLEPTNYCGPPRPLPPPPHPLAHKHIAFAGRLTINGALAKEHLVKLGAHVTKTLRHDTDFLVVGKGHSAKVIRAEQMIAEGGGLRILKEDAFLLMLENDRT